MTMLSSDILLERWNRIAHHSNGYVRIDATHPIEWNIGYENLNQKSLLLITEYEPNDLPSSKSIQVTIAQRVDSKWAVSFRLIRLEQEEVYINLCYDIIESSRKQTDCIEGIEYIQNRYLNWTKLMELQKNGLLSENEKKGLIGEILYLQQLISNGAEPLKAIESWIGPEGADQDFVDENGWHEIKALGIGAKSITISSLEQLNVCQPGELILYFVDKTAPNEPSAFSLLTLIHSTRDLVKHNNKAFELINRKLLQYGYIDVSEYEKQFYRLSDTKRYRVDELFPKLVKSNVPSQIISASYQISLQSLENWKIS